MLLIDPGVIPYSSVNDHVNLKDFSSDIIIITESESNSSWNSVLSGMQNYEYRWFDEVQYLGPIPDCLTSCYTELLRFVIDDIRTLQIAERTHHTIGWRNQFYQISRIEKLINNYFKLIKKHSITLLFFQSTPHNLYTWVLSKVAEFCNIPVFYCKTSALPWMYMLVEGLSPYKNLSLCDRFIEDLNFNDIILKDYIKLNSFNYADAIPSYERKRIDKRHGKLWSWKREIQDSLKDNGLKGLGYLPFKRIIYNKYHNLISEVNYEDDFIVFFMHFQPERTSLPEGDFYFQQWLIIKMLSMAIPKEWKLLVKEHPSTFMGKYDIRYRHPQFYEDIVKLKNVQLISLKEDNFHLIDSSLAIVTITGTVGIQALIRGKPVFAFGQAGFLDAPGLYHIKNYQDLVESISKLIEKDHINLKSEVYKYLKMVSQNCMPGYTNDVLDFYDQNIRIRGNARLLSTLILHKDYYLGQI